YRNKNRRTSRRMSPAPEFLSSRIRSLRYGALLPFEALRLILRRPSLIFWSLLPIAITLALYVAVILRAQGWAKDALMHQMAAWGWRAVGWVAILTLNFARLVLFLAGALTFSIVASITASPFNDFLAERSERFSTPPLPAVTRPGLSGKIRLIGIDVA